MRSAIGVQGKAMQLRDAIIKEAGKLGLEFYPKYEEDPITPEEQIHPAQTFHEPLAQLFNFAVTEKE